MSTSASISVIIPAFNPGRFLMEALESVQVQTLHPLETIVIDDGSTPHIEIPNHITMPVRLIRQANSGQAVARNLGIGLAEGEWLAFLDADDIWHPRKLEFQMQAAQRNPEAGIIGCRCVLVNERGEIIGKGPGLFSNQVFAFPRLSFLKEALLAGLIPSMTLVRKNSVEANPTFEKRFQPIEDIVFFDLLLSRGIQAFQIDKALLKRRMHGENLTYQYQKMLRSCLLWIKERVEPSGIHVAEITALGYLVAGQSALLLGKTPHSRSLLKRSFHYRNSLQSFVYFLAALGGAGLASHFREVKRKMQTQATDYWRDASHVIL